MNFLELCQRLRQKARIPGTGPSGVTGQSGEYLKIVEWIQEAYEDIQNRHVDWRFLLEDYSFSTVVGTKEYTPTAAGITDLNAWKRDDFKIYSVAADETQLSDEPWAIFRLEYDYASLRTQIGKPIAVTIKPSDTLRFYPIPDLVYTVNGQYYKQPATLAVNTDIPIFKVNYHMAIVWRALMLYGADVSAPEVYATADDEFKKLINKMENAEMPEILWGEPLA